MNSTILKVAGGFLAGSVVGFMAGYFVTRKSAEIAYAEIASEEINKFKEQHRLLRKEGVDLDEILAGEAEISEEQEEYAKILEDNGYKVDLDQLREVLASGVPVPSDPEVEEKTVNVFDGITVTDDLEFEEYVANRDPREPFIISVSEFMSENDGLEKIVLKYYEGDDTLVGPQNSVVPDVERLIGGDALTEFGKFSEDANVVYVRNMREGVESDFEIHRDPGEYTEIVLGLNNRAPLMKMREDD